MKVVLTSLMMEAFHVNVIPSVVSVARQDRMDIPMQMCNCIHLSPAYRGQEGLQLLKIVQDPGDKPGRPRIYGESHQKIFLNWLPWVGSTVAPHDIYQRFLCKTN